MPRSWPDVSSKLASTVATPTSEHRRTALGADLRRPGRRWPHCVELLLMPKPDGRRCAQEALAALLKARDPELAADCCRH